MNQLSLEQAAMEACLSVGIEFKHVPSDSEFYTTNIIDDHKGKGAGRLKLFSDNLGGIAYNWKTGERQSFFINTQTGVSLSKEEKVRIEAEKVRRKTELIAKQNKAALKAQSLWASATPSLSGHPYLIKKRVKPHFTRQANWTKSLYLEDKWQKITIANCLLVPLYNEAGTIRNVQAIFPEKHPELARNKDFLAGAELAGLFSWIGDKTETVCIAEGVATAFTVHEDTGFRVYIAFTANNLLAVGQTIRKHLPNATIIFTADNDKSGVGLEKATEAARAVNGLVCMPPIVGFDFNDYAIYLQDGNHDK